MAHGLVVGGIGLNFGAIQGHMAQTHNAGLLGEAQDLNNKSLRASRLLRRNSLVRL